MNFLMPLPEQHGSEPTADSLVDSSSEASVQPEVSQHEASNSLTSDAAAITFPVSQINFTPSQILSEVELHALAMQFLDRDVSLLEMNELVASVNALYREREFVTARSVLPAQDIVAGVVRIELIEARIDQIQIADNRHTRDGYIKRRIDLTPGSLADPGELQSALRQFNATNDVKLTALLKPGSKPNTTSYLLKAYEPDHQRLSVFADNAGRKTIGKERLGLNYTNNSLTGIRDRFSIGGSYADGANAAYVVYGRPINEHGTQAMVSVDYSQIVIINGDLATFNVEGTTTAASAMLSHPLQTTGPGSWYATVGYSAKSSATDFDSVDRFESRVRTFSVGAEYQHLGGHFMLYARPRINFGTDSLGGEAGALVNLSERQQLAFRLRGQWADRQQLPSAEQFQLGGAASVRGYPEGVIIGDKGYFVSMEYRYAGWAAGASQFRPFLFADHGAVFASAAGRALDIDESLTSAGLGLSWHVSDKFNANIQVGVPLSSMAHANRSAAVHFHVSYTPF